MADYKTYEYIWLDGYQPEPSMRSKVKAQMQALHRIGLLMGLQHNKLKVEALIVFLFLLKLMKILMDMT